ncbi:THAP-type domain-containing protein [Nephila pilipes]|uniref:THAP-type domain-containing protein n=1 Tax=Nephila pilipes TaxID=299642 RepID=A0A8X6PPV8_NEPPI|nr:THAP-type domain-containing protein [Nephila pilipes]
MPRFKDECYARQFCVALKKTGAEKFTLLQDAYGDNTISQNIVHPWQKMFQKGKENAAEEGLSGCPSTLHSDQNAKIVWNMWYSDRRLKVRIKKDECNIRKSTVHRIVAENFGEWNICSKLVLKVLSDEQKAASATILRDLWEH